MLIIFVDVVRFEAKSVTSKRLIMRRIAFYPVGGERVSLPERHIKAYVDDYCHEFGQTGYRHKVDASALCCRQGL